MRKAQVIQLEGSRPIKAVNCILTFEDNACYCNAAISHAQYGCHAISIRKMLVTKQECQTAYETKTFIGHSYNITGIVVNQPKVTDLIVKGSLDKASIIFPIFANPILPNCQILFTERILLKRTLCWKQRGDPRWILPPEDGHPARSGAPLLDGAGGP